MQKAPPAAHTHTHTRRIAHQRQQHAPQRMVLERSRAAAQQRAKGALPVTQGQCCCPLAGRCKELQGAQCDAAFSIGGGAAHTVQGGGNLQGRGKRVNRKLDRACSMGFKAKSKGVVQSEMH
eukprot:1160690-Pelagomonas_calceolata.AAC.11